MGCSGSTDTAKQDEKDEKVTDNKEAVNYSSNLAVFFGFFVRFLELYICIMYLFDKHMINGRCIFMYVYVSVCFCICLYMYVYVYVRALKSK